MQILPIYLTYYKILTIFSILWVFYCLFLIFLFISLNRKFKIVLFLFLFSSLFWQVAPFVTNFLLPKLTSLYITLYIKASYFTAVLCCLSGYWVTLFFFKKYLKRNFKFELSFHIIGTLCLFFSLSPNFLQRIEYTKWGASPILGEEKFFYFSLLLFLTISCSFLAIRGYLASSIEDKKRGIFFVLGLIVYEFISGSFNVFIPLITYTPPAKYYLYGNLGPLVFIVCLIFSFFTGVFPIRTILVNLLVGIFGIFLIASIFIFPGWIKFYFLILSLIFLLIGYLLIQYTQREVRQKEILEERVKERTKELEKAKNIAEEKTRELEKRKEELERVLKAVVGRELRMIELKKRIKELEEKK